ncbi:unnamed protein product, partial [Laminaria digitata]
AELCEALDLVVEQACAGGASRSSGSASLRTADLCAQALSRCPASQLGGLLAPWSRFEAVRYLADAAAVGNGVIGHHGGNGGGGGSDGSLLPLPPPPPRERDGAVRERGE